MAAGIWGKKIGMTQIFTQEKAIPVTVIDASNWVVTQIKTNERDGYDALQIACIKDRHVQDYTQDKIASWIKKPSEYFSACKEVKGTLENAQVGSPFDWSMVVSEGSHVAVLGRTIGKGFAGSVKRHGFAGGSNSHGDKLGRKSGSLSFMRSRGRVIKGKRLPGHLGSINCVVRGLEVVRIDTDKQIILVKGSVPGKSGSFLYVSKQG